MPFRITIDNNGELVLVDGWHPVDGKWVHIVQQVENENKEISYYTNGEKVFTKKIEEVPK